MNLTSFNNMKSMRCRIECGKQINKLSYFCIEECQCLNMSMKIIVTLWIICIILKSTAL